jgi:hypothetical protein
MFSLEIIKRINAEMQPVQPDFALRYHPRIVDLKRIVNRLPVDKEYRRWLRHSLWRYVDQIVARPEYPPEEGWDDLEALQQVALGDWNEASLEAMCKAYR